jgi:Bacterial Ig-like domain (group 1)/Beta-propeller repeat
MKSAMIAQAFLSRLTPKLAAVVVVGFVIDLLAYGPLPAWGQGGARVSDPQTEVPASLPGAERAAGTQARVQAAWGTLPLYFIENRGQVDARVAYYVQGRDNTVYFTPHGVTFALTGQDDSPSTGEAPVQQASLLPGALGAALDRESTRRRWALKLDFMDANPDVRPSGQDLTLAVISYFTGPREQWQTGLQTYATLVYADLWPGIDLIYSGTVHQLKYTFVAKVNAAGTGLLYAGYIGGSGRDVGMGIAVDSADNAYATGHTNSTEATFPETGGPDLTFNGNVDAFVAKISEVVQPVPATVILEPAAETNPVGTSHTVTATVTDAAGEPVEDVIVRFMVTGSVSAAGSCTTDENGECDFTYPGPPLPGVDAITAYADTNNNSVQDPGEPAGAATKTWTPVAAAVTLMPAAADNPVGTNHTVTATVTNTVGQPMPGVTVRFTVAGSVITTGSCATNVSGQCTFTYLGPALPGADLITAYPDLNNNNVQDGNELADFATKAWLLPTSTPGHVTGGGHILAPNLSDEIVFGFNARSTDKGFSGQCNLVDPSTAPKTHIRCLDVTALVQTGAPGGGGTATFFGNATVNGLSTTYRIDVADVAEPGAGRDSFSIVMNSGYTAGGLLTGGNIQVPR